jgi:hypothetical protein
LREASGQPFILTTVSFFWSAGGAPMVSKKEKKSGASGVALARCLSKISFLYQLIEQ